MASEIPVIATNVGGVKEFVFPDETGILIEPADPQAIAAAMKKLAGDADLRRRLVENAIHTVETTFTIEKMAESTLALYHKLLAKKSTASN